MASALPVSEVRTYHLIEELVAVQGWTGRQSEARLLPQQEYRGIPALRDALAAASKTGKGAGYPEYVLVRTASGEPLAVFEGKARSGDIEKAIADVKHYGDALYSAGFQPIAIAVAGIADSYFEVRVLKRKGTKWIPITYEGEPIRWVPGPDEMRRIAAGADELRPKVPAPEVLQEKAEEINGLLRESGLKDDFRPAVIGAIMLALWKDGANIRRDTKHILVDINRACALAFQEAGKPILAQSIRVDEANSKLAVRARRICEILERLNISTLTAEHDYIGALYEEFFRYTGGNTIGQYFTPRHIARFMADLCGVTKDDVVLDIACGTGGFLISAMQRMQEVGHLSRAQTVKVVQTKLIGIETEPVTAALCVANMILRGDGTTGIRRADAFEDSGFPFDAADIVLMNPPFPHKKTDDPPEKFITRALQGVKRKGIAAVIVPMSLLVKSSKRAWREELLREHRLEAVFTLPLELFQPYAAATTAIVLIRKGVPHDKHETFFCRITNDGFRLKKGVRINQPGNVLPEALRQFVARKQTPEFSAIEEPIESVGAWHPGAYIGAAPLGDDIYRKVIGQVLRNRTAFVVRFAPHLAMMRAAIARTGSPIKVKAYKRGQPLIAPINSIGHMFEIGYGQKALHRKDGLVPGNSLVISSSGADNGCYGFYEFPDLIKPPFVTVPSTGSIGEAAVQTEPCGVVDDCLVLIPKPGTRHELLYVAAATLRQEAWRFDYGRKMTPRRIAQFPLSTDKDLLAWIAGENGKSEAIESQVLEEARAEAEEALDDLRDAEVAEQRLRTIEDDPTRLVSGPRLAKRLDDLRE